MTFAYLKPRFWNTLFHYVSQPTKAEEGPYKDSVTQISALPILPDPPVDGAQVSLVVE